MIEGNTTTAKSYDTIKLGIDAHAKWYYVARQLDGATPQPVQKMDFRGLLRFVAKQQGLAREVHTCYEAGAFGYHLHRKLEAMGVRNLERALVPNAWMAPRLTMGAAGAVSPTIREARELAARNRKVRRLLRDLGKNVQSF